MIPGYSKNLNVQFLIALLKKHGIKNIITSPGGTNLELVAGLQYDNSFKMFSSVDERSAAYMACGIAAESNEPVVIVCTESTASRNYYPGITEANHRQLPILAITGVHRYSEIGNLKPQIIDRSQSPQDTFRLKVHLPIIKDKEDEWESILKINKAILELKRHGGGPVHIDLPCCDNDYDFSIKELPDVRVIKRYCTGDELPEFPSGKTAIFVGSHLRFNEILTTAVDNFCASHNAVVFCDHTSGYSGKYAVYSGLLAFQEHEYEIFNGINLLIHVGGATGDEPTAERVSKSAMVWRVNPDGELRDTFRKLTAVFEMDEELFFNSYSNSYSVDGQSESYFKECQNCVDSIEIPLKKLPFSNIYVAAKIAQKLPENSLIHLGVSNTIRAWTMVEFPSSVKSASNVGCRGIDGIMSAFIGASLVDRDRLCLCVLGDLSFFYDMNSLGNRFVGKNVRILLINNDGGGVFKLFGAPGYRFFGDRDTDKFIAAGGHFGGKSHTLVKCYAESLGFEYISASCKEEFDAVYERFVSPEITDNPILFEIFTNDYDEREAFDIMSHIDVSVEGVAKQVAKKILGQKGVNVVKKLLNNDKKN